MKDRGWSIDRGWLLERGQALWRIARDLCARDRIDLLIKSAVRRRVTRGDAGGRCLSMESRETGIALRVAAGSSAMAGFAASTGVSTDAIRWAVEAARSSMPSVDAAMPGEALVESSQREDLDRGAGLPDLLEVEGWIAGAESLRWIECGTTVELIIGNDGWAAIRGRNRTWAEVEDGRPRLLARRGFAPPPDDPPAVHGRPAPFGPMALTAAAASTLIATLAEGFHTHQDMIGVEVGPGWIVSDDPLHERGLSGGTFDDAGFPAFQRVLADGHACLDALAGAGTYRRRSFRDPPVAGPSNLVLSGPGPKKPPSGARIVSRCRVLPMSADSWLLEMGGEDLSEPPLVVRASPSRIVQGCESAWGSPSMSAEGVFTPGLVLSGLGAA